MGLFRSRLKAILSLFVQLLGCLLGSSHLPPSANGNFQAAARAACGQKEQHPELLLAGDRLLLC